MGLTLREVVEALKLDLDAPLRYVNLTVNKKSDERNEVQSVIKTSDIDIITFLHQYIEMFFEHLTEVKDDDLLRSALLVVMREASQQIKTLGMSDFEKELKKHGFLEEDDDDGTVS